MRAAIVPTAALFVGWVKEATGANDGPWVEAILRLTGNRKGDPWCAAFVCMVLDIAFKGQNPLPRSASCDVLLEAARAKKWLFTEPQVGDLFLVMRTKADAVHVGVVTAVKGLEVATIEGNTNVGGSRDGWGVFARARVAKGLAFIRIPEKVRAEVIAGAA